jgi:hypothetical protein
MEWEIIKTRTLPTLLVTKERKKYYLHSKYDPIKEAETWVDSVSIDPATVQEIILIGVGLGYHVSLLAEKYSNIIIHVFEFNYSFIKWVLDRREIVAINNKNVILHYGKDIANLLNQLSECLTDNDNLLLYKPSLELIEQENIKNSLDSFYMKKRTIREQKNSLNKNFKLNITLKDKDIRNYIGIYNNYPTILASAGPSLTKQLPLLKTASNYGIKIACVGTALLPLMNAGIKPNLIMISDPKDIILEQFQGIENQEMPLFYLSTANHYAVRNYNGPRCIVWQNGFTDAEIIATQNNVPLIDTGGSVATCLLDLIVKLGSKKIALVGQDLAFTNNMTHASGAHSYKEFNNYINTIRVDEYNGKEKIMTSRNLYIYLKWFERYVELHKDLHFWNCTEGGAHIKGWIHRPLSDFLNLNKIKSSV